MRYFDFRSKEGRKDRPSTVPDGWRADGKTIGVYFVPPTGAPGSEEIWDIPIAFKRSFPIIARALRERGAHNVILIPRLDAAGTIESVQTAGALHGVDFVLIVESSLFRLSGLGPLWCLYPTIIGLGLFPGNKVTIHAETSAGLWAVPSGKLILSVRGVDRTARYSSYIFKDSDISGAAVEAYTQSVDWAFRRCLYNPKGPACH